MKHIKSLVISFIIILIFLILGLVIIRRQISHKEEEKSKKQSREYPISKNSIELELKYSFPSEDLAEKDIYLFGARYISKDFFGNIYVSNSRIHNVFIFDSFGNFLKKIGQKGQGPGEFFRPYRVILKKDLIIVHDSGNRRIQFFDRSGKYIKNYKVYKSYMDMDIDDKGLIFAVPIRYGAHLISHAGLATHDK